MKHILFICSRNKLRSPTAEAVFSDKEGFEVQSAGLNNDAEIPLTSGMIEWADGESAKKQTAKEIQKLPEQAKSHLLRHTGQI